MLVRRCTTKSVQLVQHHGASPHFLLTDYLYYLSISWFVFEITWFKHLRLGYFEKMYLILIYLLTTVYLTHCIYAFHFCIVFCTCTLLILCVFIQRFSCVRVFLGKRSMTLMNDKRIDNPWNRILFLFACLLASDVWWYIVFWIMAFF